jgi:hypothetical protein
METRSAMNFEPRITRMGTDEDRGMQGCAWTSQAALRFQISPQARLHGTLKTHLPLAARAAQLLLYPQLFTRNYLLAGLRRGSAFACGRMRLGGIWRSFFRMGRTN